MTNRTTPVGATTRTMNPGPRVPSPAQYVTMLEAQRWAAARAVAARIAADEAWAAEGPSRRAHRLVGRRRLKARRAHTRWCRDVLPVLEAELADVRVAMVAAGEPVMPLSTRRSHAPAGRHLRAVRAA